ncbi:MAG: CRISPR-associated protein Csx19 [Chloroflexota bacterium]
MTDEKITRTWQQTSAKKTDLSFDAETDNLEAWLTKHVTGDVWLFAQALDGVIWGEIRAGKLQTSGQLDANISPQLRLKTLQQLRVFNENYEIKLWRQGNTWHALKIEDDTKKDKDIDYDAAIDEPYLLWGTFGKHDEQSAFTLMEDGVQGMRHILPPIGDDTEHLTGELGRLDRPTIRRAYIQVRHYLQENDMGVTSIGLTRFVKIGVEQYG